jgi:hypothetical protein
MQFQSIGSFLSMLPVVLLLATGCNSRPTCVPVSGKVLVDGEPLKYGGILFVPHGGRRSSGILDENGCFKLTCFEPDDGAMYGTHQIQILANESINDTTTKWHAPKKYANRTTSGLTQEISGPMDAVVIELTWKGSTPDKPFIEREDSTGDEAFAKRRRKK